MDVEQLAVAIPIVAIIMGCAIAIVAIYLDYCKHKEIGAMYHQERMAAIEKGLELPPLPENLFGEAAEPADPRGTLRKGLIWLFVGLSLTVALFVVGQFRAAVFGLVPAAVGVALLLYYWTTGRQEAEAFEAEQARRAAARQAPTQ